VKLPQFNGHAEKVYYGLGGVFYEQKEVPKIFQGIQTGSNPSGRRIRQGSYTGSQRVRVAG